MSSVSFHIAKQNTRELEGGYWLDPSAGHTYAGITYKFFPSWKGWPVLFQLARQRFGNRPIPRYTVFQNIQLDNHISEFYRVNFWEKVMNGNLFKNQVIANFIYDFLVHKKFDAVAVVNHTARSLGPRVVTNPTRITPEVITLANTFQGAFYNRLRANRESYYRNPRSIPGTREKPFSAPLVSAFIRDRVNKFPATIQPNFEINLFKTIWA
ncbi:MAG TPA: glycosyl hydrolase 108 family protein [Lacibacter sp.]|nr:glycosyl hydrolase 108 family protein [Lacibacter sp.]HMO89567.1 glycosyl hydrolase 108 family protein [Lacibacter sp.]HMP87178.1 glycosyl hydrolase 108 family protein [Lacibacter sp.]